MDLEAVKGFFNGLGQGNQLPGPESFLEKLELVLYVLVMAGPVLMVVMGLLYLFASPKEANHHFGYRCYFGMGSVEAWQYTQRIAGITWTVLGVILGTAMVLVGVKFADLELMDMVMGAVVCVLCQVAALVAASLGIRMTVALRFDRHGELRKNKRARKKLERRQKRNQVNHAE